MADLDNLERLRRAATPAPWIRRWQSTVVHWMGGDGALTSQADIDFAVALVNAAPELIAGARVEVAARAWAAEHSDRGSCTFVDCPTATQLRAALDAIEEGG
jgi:hypothetical protein